jgi:hypothetical protein
VSARPVLLPLQQLEAPELALMLLQHLQGGVLLLLLLNAAAVHT